MSAGSSLDVLAVSYGVQQGLFLQACKLLRGRWACAKLSDVMLIQGSWKYRLLGHF
ncbi:MAG: hypothetical protein ACI9PC_000861 [Porticoccaceae bacterium]|jgi:hypothetical protein